MAIRAGFGRLGMWSADSAFGGVTEDLTRLIDESSANSPQIAELATQATSQVRESIDRNASTFDTVGQVMNETKAIVQAATTGPEKERIANAALATMAAAANAVYPGIGSVMMAAVQILWRIVDPAARALSDRLEYISTGDAYMNAFLRVTGYNPSAPVGGRNNHLDRASLAKAFGDGWQIIYAPNPSRGYPWGAETYVGLATGMSSVSYTTTCIPAAIRNLAGSSLPLLREAARSVDEMYGRGEADGARNLWTKTLQLMARTFPLGSERFTHVTGIRPGACVGVVPYPWGQTLPPGAGSTRFTGPGQLVGDPPRTAEEASNPRYNLLFFGGAYVGETFGRDAQRRDLLAFKISRLPVPVAVATAYNIFTDPARWQLPCDSWIQQLVQMGQGKLDDSTGWPMSVWGMKLVESVYSVAKALADGRTTPGGSPDAKSSAVGAGTVAVAGLGVAALLYALLA